MPSGTIYVLLADINVSVVPCEVNNEKVRPCPHYGVNLAFLEVGLLLPTFVWQNLLPHTTISGDGRHTSSIIVLTRERERQSVYLSPNYSFQASVENFSLSHGFKYHKNMSK